MSRRALGPATLALAAGTAHVARDAGLPYAAVVIDHGLQEGSAAAAEEAHRALVGLTSADVAVACVDVVADGSGPGAAAVVLVVHGAGKRSTRRDRGTQLAPRVQQAQ